MAGYELKAIVKQLVQAAITSCPVCDCPPQWAILASGRPIWDAEDEYEIKYDAAPEVAWDRNLDVPAHVIVDWKNRRDGVLSIGPAFFALERENRCKAVFEALGRINAQNAITYLYRQLPKTVSDEGISLEQFFGSYWKGDIDKSYPGVYADFITNPKELYDYSTKLYYLANGLSKMLCESFGDPYMQKQAEEGIGLAYDYCKLLPGQVLYHTTSNLPSVKTQGIKTRDELAETTGKGLGGGSGDTISLTMDKMVADSIVQALIEAVMVVQGQITVNDLLQWAKEGYQAKQPYYDSMMKMENENWYNVIAQGKNVEYSYSSLGYSQSDLPPGAEFYGYTWEDANGIKRGFNYIRSATPKEKLNDAFRVYTRFLAAREFAGGTYNPLFAFADAEKISQVDLKNIGQLNYTINPDNPPDRLKVEGLGKTWLAMGEVRIPSGNNLVSYDEWIQKLIAELKER